MSNSISVILPNYNCHDLIKRNITSLPATIEGFKRPDLITGFKNNMARREQKSADQRFNKTHLFQQPWHQIISTINKTLS